MPAPGALILKKEERICSKKLIDELFTGGESHAMTSYPIRVVYMLKERKTVEEPSAMMLVSVPKRCLKHAVKRNRVKRQIREAYRKNKALIIQRPDMDARQLVMALVWLDNKVYPTNRVEQNVIGLLTRLSEKL
ncbi:ribonuclease P protein component [Prevotella sp. oral taxon 376]|uniref:ribonuclease P protein component n=1 Tax=Prevotella sp. oral taxon 376 TaxID=712466 RepID=UPI000D1F713F|nr:ribonuclease P protein component [Prevotella sp. oral taxon 376]PTL33835.1 ribonuclease P protein component [Prevotella sp. oral taxon 376]